MTHQEAKLFDTVLTDYYENETFVIVGIREHELELRGDWSAMNNVIGNSWYDIKKCVSTNHEFENIE
mgnify:CR=1 FL=1|jgi:hypothetical protein